MLTTKIYLYICMQIRNARYLHGFSTLQLEKKSHWSQQNLIPKQLTLNINIGILNRRQLSLVRIFINHISLELYISLTLQGYQKNAHMLKVVINSNFIIIFSHLASYTHILLTAFASCYLHISLIGQKLFADVMCVDFQRFAEHGFTSC